MERELIDPLFIQNAGLVLTAPYMGMLFSRLELIQHDVFVNGEAQERAVHLLGYVATGAENVPEYELVIQKVLCGMLVSEPLAIHRPLTTAEKEMADQMLVAITEHWKPLNNTTIVGLRESFLLREGQLEDGDFTYKLQVEQKSLDILLDQIPWNISKIYLNWMQKVLEVSWR
ncbi:MAG: contractile injection system tape measure protein [Marinirhabdus sp.]|nr:contractile injection system tape measure protein [Marinirhabdus sp.]